MSRFAYLFPGQGSQESGMGKELAEAFPVSRDAFATSDRVLERPLSDLCFHGDAESLALTENTQPALLTTCVAALRALESLGVRASAAAGHSLGEYTAHVAAGTFDLTDAVRTVQARGRFMQEAVPPGEGGMAAVLGLDPAAVERACRESANGEIVSAANLNSPGQVVIAGHSSAVTRAGEAAQKAGARRIVPLSVSAPFHCQLMEPAAVRLRPLLDAIEFRDPELTVYSNVDAAPLSGGNAAREALARQVASPVRWQELIERMLGDGIETFVEVGPGRVLAGLVRSIRRGVRVLPAGDPASVEKTAAELLG